MPQEEIISYLPSPFVPSTSFSGGESFYTIRGKNLWLRSKSSDQMYARAYRGSRDINEPIPIKTLTGTVAWNVGGTLLSGTGTLFLSELRVGQFVIVDTNTTNPTTSEMFVITAVDTDFNAQVSRPFTTTATGTTRVARVLPIIYPLGTLRATQIKGNSVKFPKGHLLGVGDGELLLNGQPLLNPFLLTEKPRYAIYNPVTNRYNQIDYGMTLLTTTPLFSAAEGAAGAKNMFAGDYGIRVVASSTDTGGYSNPSANVKVTITANKKIRITFLAPMNTADGQDAYDIYVTKYQSTTAAPSNAILGPHFLLERVTAAQLATENGVANGTVAGLFHDIEYSDAEISASNQILTFDNFPPVDAEFVDVINFTPIFFSCLGKASPSRPTGTSPGSVVISGKPDNPEAVFLNKSVSTAQGDTILGVLSVRGRFWLLCENSLQAVILTGVDAAPITCRSFWDAGFRNPYNAKFVKDYIFAHSTNGFLRSIGVGDESSVDFEFSSPVDDYTTNWLTAHVLVGYCPKNKAVCYFFSGYDRSTGYWKTLVLPFLPNQSFWNPPIVLEKANQDFIVSGVATVGQALYFLAGGRKSDNSFQVKTYEFDAPDGIQLECALAWTYSDFGAENSPSQVVGVASLIGNVDDAKLEIHGIDESGVYDLTALENGHNNTDLTIVLGSTPGLGRIREKRQTIKSFSKFSPRISFKSTNGASRLDELNLLISSNSSRK